MQDTIQTMINVAQGRNAAFAGDFMTILYSQLAIAYDVADKARQFAPESWKADAETVFEKVAALLTQVDSIRP